MWRRSPGMVRVAVGTHNRKCRLLRKPVPAAGRLGIPRIRSGKLVPSPLKSIS